jgi:superoxide oxidase
LELNKYSQDYWSTDSTGQTSRGTHFVRSITPADRDARYSPFAMFMHWVMALLIVLAWILPQISGFVPRENGPLIMGLHRSLGVTLLALLVLRALWRLASPPPPLPGGTTQLIRFASRAGHTALYLLMLAVPVLGILYTWAGGNPLSIWGLGHIQPPAWVDPEWRGSLRDMHALCANAIIFLSGLHVAAAMIHHYVFKDGLLDRMLPARFRTERPRHSALI